MRFADTLKDLAEGRMDPDAWIGWWDENAAEVEAVCPRGCFLKLKPRRPGPLGANEVALGSQGGACSILEALKLPFVRSDRYQIAWNEDFQRFCAAEKERKRLRIKELEPRLKSLEGLFPKFARFLRRRAGDVDQIDEPATDSEISAIENALGVPLPQTFKQLLNVTRELHMNALSLGVEQVFRHPAEVGGPTGSICIADYWLEADGDQVLVEYRPDPLPDPPVFYYAHEQGSARPLASRLTEWIESLSRSPIFRT
jgi:hypothetical protein